MVAVFDEIACCVAVACAEIDGEHGLDLRRPAPVHELLGAEVVRLGGEPGEIEPGGPVLGRAHPVLPIVAGDEVAARITHDRRAELLDEFEHVIAEAALVGSGMAGFVDAAIDAAAQMLDEGAEEPRVGVADGEGAIAGDAGLSHDVTPGVATALRG